MELLVFILITTIIAFLLIKGNNVNSSGVSSTAKVESSRENYSVAISSRGLYCILTVESTEPLISYVPQKLFHDPWTKSKIDRAQRSIGPVTTGETTQFCQLIRDCLKGLALEPLFPPGNLSFAGILFPRNLEYVEEPTIALRVDEQGYSSLVEPRDNSNRFYFVEGVVQEEKSGLCYQLGFYIRLDENHLYNPSLEGKSHAGVTYYSAESDEIWATKRLVEIGREGNWASRAKWHTAEKLEEIKYFKDNAASGSLVFEARQSIDNDYREISQTLHALTCLEKELHLKEKNIIDWINLPTKFKSRDEIAGNEASNTAYMEAKEKYEEVLELIKLYNLS